jgi:hypothetical protein
MMSDYISWMMAQALIARHKRSVDPWKSIKKGSIRQPGNTFGGG